MMYKELVKDLMEKQREARKDLKLTQVQEREAAMINVLADVKTVAKELKCEYLLETAQAPVEEIVNSIVINKGKIVKVEVEKIVEVEKVIEKIIEKKVEIKVIDQDAIDKAVKEVRDNAVREYTKMKKSSATWQSKYNSLLTEFNKLKVQSEVQQDNIYTDEYMEYMAQQQEACEEILVPELNLEVETLKDESKQEEPIEIKLSQLKVRFRNQFTKAQLFKFDNGFVMGSPKVKELTYLPNIGHILSEEVKSNIEKSLVKDYNFDTDRVEMSPYVITRPNAYFVRTNAIKGIDVLSKDDTFAGYVALRGKYYLFTYRAENSECFADDLNKLIANENSSRPSRTIREEMNKLVLEMYAEYCAKIKTDGKDDDVLKEQAEELAKKTIEKNAEAAAKYQAELEKAKAQFNKGGDKKENTKGRRRQAPNFLSDDSLNSLNKAKAADYADLLI